MVKELKIQAQNGGRKPKLPEERRVQISYYVQRKYYNQAQKEVDEILKKYI